MKLPLPIPLLAAALLLGVAASTVPPASPAPAAPATSAPAPDGQFRFSRLNRTYQDVASEILPVESGPLAVRLTSPRNTLTVRNHLLRLEPGADGTQAAELAVTIEGRGRMVADLALAGFEQRFADDVVVPAQTQRLEGRLRLARVEGGYLVTPEQLPRRLAVRIRSGIGEQIVGFCEGVSLLPGLTAHCDGLRQALSTAVVPLPPPGEGFLLEDAELTAADRRQLDGYLAASAPRP